MVGQPGFFDFDDRLRRLSDLGDQLEAFAAAVDFELFRPVLDAALAYADGAKGGRPPLDPVLMFKVLIIQAANGLSDERAEYLINDRLSFMRFLGLSLGDRVPDARTIWLFRERLTRANGTKSKVRARIEHVFAEQKSRMGLFIRTVGIARARTKIGVVNLVYNLKRLIVLERWAAIAAV